MIYTPMTKKALKICFEAHKNQLDKSGMPYVFHPFHLAEQMDDEDAVIVALLHDVIEDTDLTLDELCGEGFSENVLSAISLMTHKDGTDYMEYVKNIKQNEIARKVKLADLYHNSDATRLDSLDGQAQIRLEKYKRAIELLES